MKNLPDLTREQVHELLTKGVVEREALAPWGTNYTYFVQLRLDGIAHPAVYKPRRGEAPLYDFPSGTLYRREYAAYLVSHWLGWQLVPHTVIRDGPYGVGSMQIYVLAEGEPHVYSLTEADAHDLRRLVLFDLIVNNADRKPAHCFKGRRHGIWAIDHGLTFHHYPKLRTVIWDFCGEEIPKDILEEFRAAYEDPRRVGWLNEELSVLLAAREVSAFWRRVEGVLSCPRFPDLDPRYNVPYGFA